MLRFKYLIQDSTLPGAGKGLFTEQNLKRGSLIIFPNQEHQLFDRAQWKNLPANSIEAISAIRWFEDIFSVDPEWSPESHLNHSFTPNAVWHLGFVFALRDIQVGEEIFINYGLLLDEDETLDFKDSMTGREIKGLPYEVAIGLSATQVAALFKESVNDLASQSNGHHQAQSNHQGPAYLG